MADLARIKNNVAKMAAQNAPEADIDGYIASEGVTIDDVRDYRPGSAAQPSQAYRDASSEMSAMTQALDKPSAGPGNAEFGSIEATDLGIIGNIGNRLYDAGKALGLPVSRMRDDVGSLNAGVRGAADMMTLGTADEIAAGLGAATGVGGNAGNYSGNLELQRALDENDEQKHPGARLVGQLAGGLALPVSKTGSVGKAALEGAGYGGAYGFGSGEGGIEDRAWNAAPAAAAGGIVGGAIRAGANAAQTRAARKAIPSINDLRTIADKGYKIADEAGVVVRPEGMRKLATETVNDLTDFGYHPQLQPKIGSILGEMDRLANTNTTYKGLNTLRQIAGRVAGSTDPSESQMATRIIKRLDDYMTDLPVDDVIMGDAAKASAGLKQGRENWAKMRRAEMVDTAAVKAERRAATSGTGGNLDNALRQNVRSILDNPKRSRGMTPQEIEMAEKVVHGTKGQDALRLIGRLSPTTGGLSAMMNVGAAAYNPALAIPGVVGMGAKTFADRMTVKNVQKLSEMIRSGGKTAQLLAKMARNDPLSGPETKMIEALANHLGVPLAGLSAAVANSVH